MTTFNVRIPGLKLTVVQADGLDVRPVEVDEFQIAVAETYDIIVTPTDDRAYTLIGESVDRSGMARATLAPRERSEEHTSELQSLMRISYAVFCLKKKRTSKNNQHHETIHS